MTDWDKRMGLYDNKPEPFLDLIIHDKECCPGLTTAIGDYENGEWRHDEFAEYIVEWLPEFALKYSEVKDIGSATAVRLLKKAARTVYDTDKYDRRGEFGEVLLHALMREVFDSQPVVSKIYYKTATNDTVKGFDAVHVVEVDDVLELWLGEVKFYKSIGAAIRDVVQELQAHTKNDYLRTEFSLVSSKIDPAWEHAKEIEKLISKRTSLDKVFKRICVPVLLTYDSEAVCNFSEKSDECREAIEIEISEIHTEFSAKDLPAVKIHLFLIPLGSKDCIGSAKFGQTSFRF